MIRLIMYDIANNKARTKLASLLQREGFERLQYSVFAGAFDTVQWQGLRQLLKQFYNEQCEEDDKIYGIVIEKDHFKKMAVMGPPPDIAYIAGETEVLYFG